ncbi:MAG: serine/threonine protein kinase, partial [Gemmataceae bacterium]|nr:serine/threonine protein kinase [Gemmataceae bacterium]
MARIYGINDEPVPGYRLLKFLGRGGFGEVWKASAPGGTEAALKIITLGGKHALREFRAVRLVKRIHHANLVPINALWLKDDRGDFLNDTGGDLESLFVRSTQEGELIIAMGLGDKNLHDRLKECLAEGKPGIPPDELLDYMDSAAKALDFLNQPRHDLGTGPNAAVQHCDIKPQNLLIVGDVVQVCDYGLVRVLGEDMRSTSNVAGSYAYIAPELLSEVRPSKSTDQYSLAISYYELRSGTLPFESFTLYEVMMAHTKGQLNLAKVPEAEQAVLRRATARQPEERYASCAEMVKALRKVIEGRSSSRLDSGGLRPEELLQPKTELIPDYKLVRRLGRGGYGEVWEATAPGGKIRVALKVIGNLEKVEGQQEYKALELIAGVRHNHLMELHGYWLLDGSGAIIPDEVRGQPEAPKPKMLVIATRLADKNLYQRLQECQKQKLPGIPVPELLGYLRQAAQAIDYLNRPIHKLGDRTVSIQHRDIKPENLLLLGDAIKVGDFGLAKVVEGTEAEAMIRSVSTGLTQPYAAPEVWMQKVSRWTDQYALAITYYHLRSGTYPFKPQSTPIEIMMIHLEGRHDFSWVSETERAVLVRATAVNPEERFPGCIDLVTALEEACGLPGTPSTRLTKKTAVGGEAAGGAAAQVLAVSTPLKPDAAPTSAHFPVDASPLPLEGLATGKHEGIDDDEGTFVRAETDPSHAGCGGSDEGLIETSVPPQLGSGLEGDTRPRPEGALAPSRPRDLDRPVTARAFSTIPPGQAVEAQKRQPPPSGREPQGPNWARPNAQASPWRSRLTILLLLLVGGPLLGLGIVGLGRFLGIGATDVASNQMTKELQEAIAAGRFREVAERLQEPATKSVLTAKAIEELTELNTNGWLQLAAREFIDLRYDRADQIVQEIRACYPGDAEARQLAERIQQKQTEQAQVRQQLGVPVKEFEQTLERRRL